MAENAKGNSYKGKGIILYYKYIIINESDSPPPFCRQYSGGGGGGGLDAKQYAKIQYAIQKGWYALCKNPVL